MTGTKEYQDMIDTIISQTKRINDLEIQVNELTNIITTQSEMIEKVHHTLAVVRVALTNN